MSQVSRRFVVERNGRGAPTTVERGDPLSTPTNPDGPAKQTLDQIVANRTAAKLPAPPVFQKDVVEVTPGAAKGRKAATELEAAARANAQAADEARSVALAQRRALEEIATARADTEKQLAALRREMLEERSEHERMVAQARFRAIQEERRRLGAPLPTDTTSEGDGSAPAPPPPTFSPELRTLQTELAEREQLGEAHRQRLLEALRERDAARLELQRVSDARLHAERRLEKVTEVLHRATSTGGPRPIGGDGVEEQHVRELRDELAIAVARAKSAETRTNELRDEIESVRTQRTTTNDTLEATRGDLDRAREELSVLHARLLGVEAQQRTSDSTEVVAAAQARARAIEREVVETRTRALEAEQRVAELTEQLGSVGHRVDDADAVIASLRLELGETRTAADAADRTVAELQARAEAAEGRLVDVDGVRAELDDSVDGLRAAAAAAEARVRDLEAELASLRHEHEQHAVDLQATHAATAAELTSASARAEHLASRDRRSQRPRRRVGRRAGVLPAARRNSERRARRLVQPRGEHQRRAGGRHRPHRPADGRARRCE